MAEANVREPNSYFGKDFNLKLDGFVMYATVQRPLDTNAGKQMS
jgi:hypothetical protein